MVKFALTLSDRGRNEAARREVVSYLSGFGIEHTGGGHATLSFAASDASFAAAFRQPPAPAHRDASTIGASAPLHQSDIPVPDRLSALVDYVSVTPPARHFGGKS